MLFFENEAASSEYVKSKTAVWWDIDTCPVPDGYDARRAVWSIECALKDLDYTGPLTITAVGNMEKIPDVLRGLCSAGIKVQHSNPETTGIVIYSDLASWQDLNPAPATIMIISDKVKDEMNYALCKDQQRRRYNLLLGYSGSVGNASILDTTAEWVWEDLLAAYEQRGPVLGKPSSDLGESASLFCSSCDFTGHTLEKFVTHLSTEKHAQKEIDINKSRAPPSEESKAEVEPPPKNRRLRKSSLHLLNYRLAKSKRLKKAFRKDCRLLQDHLGHLYEHLGRLLTKRRS